MGGGARPHLEALERYATLGDEAPGRSAAHDVLSALNRPLNHQGRFALLVDLGLWTPHENLFLRRTQIPTHFSSKVLDASNAV